MHAQLQPTQLQMLKQLQQQHHHCINLLQPLLALSPKTPPYEILDCTASGCARYYHSQHTSTTGLVPSTQSYGSACGQPLLPQQLNETAYRLVCLDHTTLPSTPTPQHE